MTDPADINRKALNTINALDPAPRTRWATIRAEARYNAQANYFNGTAVAARVDELLDAVADYPTNADRLTGAARIALHACDDVLAR